MLKFADRDEDGKATWVEAIKAPRFTMGRMRFTNDSQAASTIRMFDTNTNGLVDRVEVRQYIARYFNGPTFSLTANNYGQTRVFSNGRVMSSGGRQADVKTLLDTDKDGVLSEKEIAAASDRLKSRDADDNDLLYSSEVSGTATARGAYRSQVIRGGSVSRANSLYYLIGPTVSSDQIHNVLTQIYKDSEGKVLAESFAQVSELFKALDKNKNGVLDKDEAGALNSVKPRMTLLMEFNQKEGGKLTANGVVAKNNSTSVELPGIKISISASTAKPRVINYSQTAKSYMTRYDGDKNGYLEKKELAGNFARQFETWDIDADGKVFEKEIAESYNLMQRPAQTQFRASVVNQGNPLFQTLDLSGDGRLSLREMRTAAKQVLKFDKNKDGRITANEIPQTIAITFSRGNASYSYVRTGSALSGGRTRQPAAKPNQPAWFTRMDRNGDGDITLKEFLGEKADFEKLDTNKDGFIEPSEVKKAE
jgi:Ca2+-binding EF-hand superfamily protein